MKKTDRIMMAFGAGTESIDVTPVKRYIGVAPVYVAAINPSKEELESIYGTTQKEAPVYHTVVTENGQTIHKTRIDILVKTDPTHDMCKDIEARARVSFFLTSNIVKGSQSGKIKVVDIYGRTAWVTPTELESHAIPMYSNGPADIDRDYRPLYEGEEDLTEFIKAYLGIESLTVMIDGQRVPNPRVQPSECQARIDFIEDLIKGNVTELKNTVALRPTNKVKVAFGIRNTDDGKTYQSVYNHAFVKYRAKSLNGISKSIQERKDNGGLQKEEYSTENLHEYTVEATSFANNPSTVAPETGFGAMPF